MSVILYNNEKFVRIYGSLKPKGRELAHIWSYPDGWDTGGMDRILRGFCDDLRRANIITWNQQYPKEAVPLEVVEFQAMLPYRNPCELLKSLRGVSYNLVTNNGSTRNLLGCADKLRQVIEYVTIKIIDKIPEYEKALTW